MLSLLAFQIPVTRPEQKQGRAAILRYTWDGIFDGVRITYPLLLDAGITRCLFGARSTVALLQGWQQNSMGVVSRSSRASGQGASTLNGRSIGAVHQTVAYRAFDLSMLLPSSAGQAPHMIRAPHRDSFSSI